MPILPTLQSRTGKAAILASGKTANAVVTIVIAAVLARLLSKYDYATYRQTMLVYAFIGPIMMLGLDRSLYYFMPNEPQRSRGLLLENLGLLALGGSVIGLFLVAGGNVLFAGWFDNPQLASALLIFAPYPLLMMLIAPVTACLLAQNCAGRLAAFTVISRVVMLVAVVVPCLILPIPEIGVLGATAGAAAGAALAGVLMARVCRTGNWRLTLDGLRRQITYCIPLGLGSLAIIIARQLDRLMVAALCEPEAFAVFVNGAIEIPLVSIVANSVTSVLIVDFARLHREGRDGEIVKLVHRAVVKITMVLLPAMAFLMCVAPELMRLLFGAAYDASAQPFRVYLLMLPARALAFGAVLLATGNSRYIMYGAGLGLAVQVVLAWYAIKLFGATGAAAAAVVVLYCVSVPFMLIVLRRVLATPAHALLPWGGMFRVGLAGVLPALPLLLVRNLVALPDGAALLLGAAIYAAGLTVTFDRFGLLRLRSVLAALERPRR
jgi:O-antigen/teichoic acid export membrane protein